MALLEAAEHARWATPRARSPGRAAPASSRMRPPALRGRVGRLGPDALRARWSTSASTWARSSSAGVVAGGARRDAARARGSGGRSVIRPLFTSAKTTGTTSWPWSASSHCTGRAKLCSTSPQRMRFLNSMPCTAAPSTPGQERAGRAPGLGHLGGEVLALGRLHPPERGDRHPLRLGELGRGPGGRAVRRRRRPSPRGRAPAGWRRGSGPPPPPPAPRAGAAWRRCARPRG